MSSRARSSYNAAGGGGRERDRPGHSAHQQQSEAEGGRPTPFERPYDCTIVATHKDSRAYAELVERRLIELNLSVDVVYLITPKETVVDKEQSDAMTRRVVESLARRGMLYAVLVERANVKHKTVTVLVMRGTPEEHRNMPLDDALAMLASNLDKYLSRLRSGTDQPSLSFLLHLLADGRHLSEPELGRIAQYLADRVGATASARPNAGMTSSTPANTPPNEHRQPPPISYRPAAMQQQQPAAAQYATGGVQQLQQQQQQAVAQMQQLNAAPVPAAYNAVTSQPATSGYAGNVQPAAATVSSGSASASEQQQLQAKILSLLNKNTGVGGPDAAVAAASGGAPPVAQAQRSSAATGGQSSSLLNSPEAVSKALHTLLASNAFKGATTAAAGNAPAPPQCAATVSTAAGGTITLSTTADGRSGSASASASRTTRMDMDSSAWYRHTQGKAVPLNAVPAAPPPQQAQLPPHADHGAQPAPHMHNAYAQQRQQQQQLQQPHQQQHGGYGGTMPAYYGQQQQQHGYYQQPQPTAATAPAQYGAYGGANAQPRRM